jgi:hypothetical protein
LFVHRLAVYPHIRDLEEEEPTPESDAVLGRVLALSLLFAAPHSLFFCRRVYKRIILLE